MELYSCELCGTADAPEGAYGCTECLKRFPESLAKACSDEFDYAMGLKSGDVIRFRSARIDGDFVHLDGEEISGLRYPCPRGVDVRISEIMWCADAPEGS